MLIGEAPATKDLIKIMDHDFNVVSAASIGVIFILIALVLKSISLPVILVAVNRICNFCKYWVFRHILVLYYRLLHL